MLRVFILMLGISAAIKRDDLLAFGNNKDFQGCISMQKKQS